VTVWVVREGGPESFRISHDQSSGEASHKAAEHLWQGPVHV